MVKLFASDAISPPVVRDTLCVPTVALPLMVILTVACVRSVTVTELIPILGPKDAVVTPCWKFVLDPTTATLTDAA